jgi:hypothetical protein
VTPVARWAPPFREALRLAWRPALAYVVFTGLGSLVLLLTVAVYSSGYDSGKDTLLFALGLGAGIVGVVAGQMIAVLRVRALPVMVASGICVWIGAYIMALAQPPGGEYVAVPALFFLFAFPCGLLSLMHRYELLASFWPAVGWIGAVFWILNCEHRITQWEESKASAWLALPLAYLACFLVLWLVYLAAKQAARVEMWQALSGAAARRIEKTSKERVGALPRKNLLAIIVVAGLLFGATAVLAPYLWRTGKGDHGDGGETKPDKPSEPRKAPDFDAEGIVRQLQKMANAAKETLPKLWPLLFLILLYRPAKRALLLTHLKSPIVPTPPSERIDNLWEYVRIAAEDADVIPLSADSVEQLMTRIREAKLTSPALEKSAEIYVRTRYGFVVQPGDAIAMRVSVGEAAAAIRRGIGVWATVKNQWRPLT